MFVNSGKHIISSNLSVIAFRLSQMHNYTHQRQGVRTNMRRNTCIGGGQRIRRKRKEEGASPHIATLPEIRRNRAVLWITVCVPPLNPRANERAAQWREEVYPSYPRHTRHRAPARPQHHIQHDAALSLTRPSPDGSEEPRKIPLFTSILRQTHTHHGRVMFVDLSIYQARGQT